MNMPYTATQIQDQISVKEQISAFRMEPTRTKSHTATSLGLTVMENTNENKPLTNCFAEQRKDSNSPSPNGKSSKSTGFAENDRIYSSMNFMSIL